MAIYHLSIKTFSRSKGQSATAAVAYRAGAKIECEQEGRTHDYTRKAGVLHSEIFLPDDAPSWAADRQQLWNKAEEAETRKNSTVAREFEIALPKELDEQQRIALVQDFAKQIVERHGCAVDAHLHDDDSRRTKQNHHAHIMLTTRKLEKDGFTKKTRELDQKQSGEVGYWREQWAITTNEHLREHGIRDKNNNLISIDHRSLKDQGLEREPTIKMGVNASALERKGIKTERGDFNRSVTAYNPDKLNEILTTQFKQAQEFHNKLQFIKRRLPEIKRDLAEKQPKLYQSLDDLGIPTAEPERQVIEPVSAEIDNQVERSQKPIELIERSKVPMPSHEAANPQVMPNKTQDIAQIAVPSAELRPTPQKVEQAKADIESYRTLLESIEKAMKEHHQKPLQDKLNKMQADYNKAEKPFFMKQKTWISKQAEQRKEIQNIRRQFEIGEVKNYSEPSKKYLAKKFPEAEQAYRDGQDTIYDSQSEHREKVRQQIAERQVERQQQREIKVDDGIER